MASEGASWGEEGYGAQDAQIQHSDEQVDNFAQDSHVSGDAADNGTEDGGDYDPESVTLGTPSYVPEATASATPSQRQPSKPKMSGGFLVEASDDEDEEPTNGSAEPTASNSHSQASAPNASPQVNSGVVPIPAPSVPSNVTPALAGLDPVALLEARVKEDPRGDMDAWLNLIADHRRNSRLNEARSTYSRFLEVFPQAVSNFQCALNFERLTLSRPISGWSGSRWNSAWTILLMQSSSLAGVL